MNNSNNRQPATGNRLRVRSRPVTTQVIFNPKAGQGTAERQMREFANQTEMGVSWAQTDGPGAARHLAREAAAAGLETVVAAGGDGTVNEVLNGLIEGGRSDRPLPTLGVLPMGSANDFALGLGLPSSSADAWQRIRRGQRRSIDIGRIENETGQVAHFCLGTGLGFIGQAAIERHQIARLRGASLYMLATLRTLYKYRPAAAVRIELDGKLIERPILTIFINNCPSIGGMPLTPRASMDDGKFDVVIVPVMGKIRLVSLMLKLRQGRHQDEPEFRLEQASQIRITFPGGCPLHIDGETAAFEKTPNREINISLLPRLLQVLV